MTDSRQKQTADADSAVKRLISRRRFVQTATAGTAIAALGGAMYVFVGEDLTSKYEGQTREDGRPRVPPGQRVIEKLKPMGGAEGNPDPGAWRLRVHGEGVSKPFEIDFRELRRMSEVEAPYDVHCVTGWSVMDPLWTGVRVKDLAERAQINDDARFVIFEAAHGYTANVPIEEALRPNVLVAHRLDGDPLEHWHGGPVRAVVPNLYFWKSAKWLTGIRFQKYDEPGYWEVRGYHNFADPWKEQRHG